MTGADFALQLDQPIQQAGFWFTLLLYVGATVVTGLLQSRSRPEVPKPAGLEDLQLPVADERAVIPIVWGRARLDAPRVVWYGDFFADPVQDTVSTGLFSQQTIVTGYRYFLGIHLLLCHGPLEFEDGIFPLAPIQDDKPIDITTAPHPSGDHWNLKFPQMRAQFLWWHIRDIGLLAWANTSYPPDVDTQRHAMEFYRGSLTQTADPYLEEKAGATLPAYRGVAHVVLRRWYIGESPHVLPLSFILRRHPNQLGIPGGKHFIVNSDGSNPACILYEILTDTRWGLGLAPATIDVANFIAVGEVLHAESFGIGMITDKGVTANDLVEDILRHIDGVLFSDPFTGLLTLKLARADYVVNDLPLFDESNSDNFEISRPGWAETHNMVRVTFRDATASFRERTATETNLANVQLRGGQMSILEVDYPGITDPPLAQRVAARDLKAASYPFASVSFNTNRQGWALRPGAVVRATSQKDGLSNMPVRIIRVSPGTLLDGKVRVNAVEDAFAVDWTGNTSLDVGEWVDPISPPAPLGAQRLEEAPFAAVGGDHRRLIALGARGEGLVTGYQVWSDPAGGTTYAKTGDSGKLTPIGILTGVLGWTATQLTIGGVLDVGMLATITPAELASGKNLLLVDDEWMAWQTIVDNGNGTFTLSGIVRGVMDTSPRRHYAGARVWFPTAAAAQVAPGDYGSDVTVAAKLPSSNVRGLLPLAQTLELKKTTTSRTTRPYVPTAVKLNALDYPNGLSGELTVSWSHRNRLGAWGYDDAGATASPEASATYRVKIYGDGGGWGKQWGTVWGGYGKLKHTESGITGTSYTYPSATEMAENGGIMNTYRRVTVEALVSALVGHQAYDYVIGANGGWGINWGNDWGI